MAKKIALPFKEIALKIVGPTNSLLASRVQRFEVSTNFPSTDIDELGNSNHAGVTTGTPEVSTTFQAMDVSTKIFGALAGAAEPYPALGVSIKNLKDIDVIGQIKDENAADFVKTVHGKKLRISGFTYTYTVDGEGTEEYTAQGTEKRWFKNDVIVERFTTPGTAFTLTNTPITLKNGNKVVSVVADGVYLDEVVSAPAAGQYSVSGTALTTGTAVASQVLVVYHGDPAGNNWVEVTDNTIPVGIKGKNIPITIGINNIPRVQSLTIRGTFPTQKVEEMGNTSLVGYTSQVPQVTGDITVLDTDLELIALLTTGEITPSGVTEYNACEFTASGLSVKVELHDPASGCGTSGAILKTLYIPEITITSEGHTSSVGGNSQQTFGFKSTTGDLIIYSGAM